MIVGNFIVAALLFLLGLAVTINSWFLDIGSLSRPSAGMLPFGLGLLLCICSLPLCLHYLRGLKREPGFSDGRVWASVNFTKIAYILVSLVMYMALLRPLGFISTAFCVQFILFKVVGNQKWFSALLQTAVTIAIVYLFFIVLLEVYIPLFPEWMY